MHGVNLVRLLVQIGHKLVADLNKRGGLYTSYPNELFDTLSQSINNIGTRLSQGKGDDRSLMRYTSDS